MNLKRHASYANQNANLARIKIYVNFVLIMLKKKKLLVFVKMDFILKINYVKLAL